MNQELAPVVHTYRGSLKAVMTQYHRDVDTMGWQGYVEVTHTLKDLPRRWSVLLRPPQKEMVVTYRRLD